MKILKNYVLNKNEAEVVSKVREEYVSDYCDFLVKEGIIGKKSVVVDVPCGTGDMVASILKKTSAQKFILIDVNPVMIASAREKLSLKENIFVIGDAADIRNLVTEPVDTILCLNGLHQYIERKEDFLKGCASILKPNGRMIFDIATRGLNDAYTKKFFALQEKELALFIKKYGTTPNMPKWCDRRALKEYEHMVTRCGLKICDIKEFITWKSFTYVMEGATKIVGRSRPWLPCLDDNQRKEALAHAINYAATKLGKNKIEHNRLFFVCGL